MEQEEGDKQHQHLKEDAVSGELEATREAKEESRDEIADEDNIEVSTPLRHFTGAHVVDRASATGSEAAAIDEAALPGLHGATAQTSEGRSGYYQGGEAGYEEAEDDDDDNGITVSVVAEQVAEMVTRQVQLQVQQQMHKEYRTRDRLRDEAREIQAEAQAGIAAPVNPRTLEGLTMPGRDVQPMPRSQPLYSRRREGRDLRRERLRLMGRRFVPPNVALRREVAQHATLQKHGVHIDGMLMELAAVGVNPPDAVWEHDPDDFCDSGGEGPATGPALEAGDGGRERQEDDSDEGVVEHIEDASSMAGGVAGGQREHTPEPPDRSEQPDQPEP